MRLLGTDERRGEMSGELRTFRVQTDPRGTPRGPGSPLFLIILRDVVLRDIIETWVTLRFWQVL